MFKNSGNFSIRILDNQTFRISIFVLNHAISGHIPDIFWANPDVFDDVFRTFIFYRVGILSGQMDPTLLLTPDMKGPTECFKPKHLQPLNGY